MIFLAQYRWAENNKDPFLHVSKSSDLNVSFISITRIASSSFRSNNTDRKRFSCFVSLSSRTSS